MQSTQVTRCKHSHLIMCIYYLHIYSIKSCPNILTHAFTYINRYACVCVKWWKQPPHASPTASGESPSASGAAKQKASQLALRSINRIRGGGTDPPGIAWIFGCLMLSPVASFRGVVCDVCHLPKIPPRGMTEMGFIKSCSRKPGERPSLGRSFGVRMRRKCLRRKGYIMYTPCIEHEKPEWTNDP